MNGGKEKVIETEKRHSALVTVWLQLDLQHGLATT